MRTSAAHAASCSGDYAAGTIPTAPENQTASQEEIRLEKRRVEMEMRYTGGCLCGALRYEAVGEPDFAGYCFCGDCRKASGSGFVPFMGFPAGRLKIAGETRQSRVASSRGGEAVRNFCSACGSLVFGGLFGVDDSHTVYAGTLDDPSLFKPGVAIFNRARPPWAILPDGLTVFEEMPPG
jgi:hypothetical protein